MPSPSHTAGSLARSHSAGKERNTRAAGQHLSQLRHYSLCQDNYLQPHMSMQVFTWNACDYTATHCRQGTHTNTHTNTHPSNAVLLFAANVGRSLTPNQVLRFKGGDSGPVRDWLMLRDPELADSAPCNSWHGFPPHWHPADPHTRPRLVR